MTSDNRRYDLYDIKKMRKKATNAFERKQCDKALRRIYREVDNDKVGKLRENLIDANRRSDVRNIKYLDRELRKYRTK